MQFERGRRAQAQGALELGGDLLFPSAASGRLDVRDGAVQAARARCYGRIRKRGLCVALNTRARAHARGIRGFTAPTAFQFARAVALLLDLTEVTGSTSRSRTLCSTTNGCWRERFDTPAAGPVKVPVGEGLNMKRVRVAPGKFVVVSQGMAEKAARVCHGRVHPDQVREMAAAEPKGCERSVPWQGHCQASGSRVG